MATASAIAPIPARTRTKGSYFTRGTSHDRYSRYTEDGGAYVDSMKRPGAQIPAAADTSCRGPLRTDASGATRFGAIYFGSTTPAMDEAAEILKERGRDLDRLRLRASPFNRDVTSFIARPRFRFRG